MRRKKEKRERGEETGKERRREKGKERKKKVAISLANLLEPTQLYHRGSRGL